MPCKFSYTAVFLQGLIHITELSWDKVMTPEDVVQPGSLVHCKVIKVDKEKLHINLSLKVGSLSLTCLLLLLFTLISTKFMLVQC